MKKNIITGVLTVITMLGVVSPAFAVTTSPPAHTLSPAPASSVDKRNTFLRTLSVGSKGSDVVQLQTFLEQKNFLVMPRAVKKGYFGLMTRTALKKYQKSVGLSPIGSVGPKTRTLLNSSI